MHANAINLIGYSSVFYDPSDAFVCDTRVRHFLMVSSFIFFTEKIKTNKINKSLPKDRVHCDQIEITVSSSPEHFARMTSEAGERGIWHIKHARVIHKGCIKIFDCRCYSYNVIFMTIVFPFLSVRKSRETTRFPNTPLHMSRLAIGRKQIEVPLSPSGQWSSALVVAVNCPCPLHKQLRNRPGLCPRARPSIPRILVYVTEHCLFNYNRPTVARPD